MDLIHDVHLGRYLQIRIDIMISILKNIIPTPLLKQIRFFKLYLLNKRNLWKSTEDVFTEIYTKNKWGGQKGEFDSGAGTSDQKIVFAYISMISEQASLLDFNDKTFVDLGCGDFRVGKQLLSLCSQYIGVDVVKPLILRNQEKYENKKTKFMHLDIIEDELPEGDVCFVRQVFQHLSNKQIASILTKLRKYKYVFITEHYPTDNNFIKPNLDKVHGGDVRVYQNSGVYLSEPPFRLPSQSLNLLLEVRGSGLWEKHDQGVIRTFLYAPQDLH